MRGCSKEGGVAVHSETEKQRVNRAQAVGFVMFVLIFLFIFTHRRIYGQNDLSRFVAVESLLLRGTFHIDGSPWTKRMEERGGREVHELHDMVYNQRDGHFYSSKPPVYTMILAGVLWPLKKLGAVFPALEPWPAVPVFLLTWLVVGGMSACGFYCLRRKAGEWLQQREADLVTVLTLGGTLFLTYSVTMNHHTFTAALVLMSFFLLGMAEAAPVVKDGRAAAAGFLMALASVVDIGHGVAFSIAFGLYILFYLRSWRTLIFFGLGALAPLCLHCVVQYRIWGSVLPVQLISGTKDYAGTYWQSQLEPDIWQIPRYYYWLLTLFSMRGLFVLSPILLIGAAGLIGDIVKWARAAGQDKEGGESGRAVRGAGYVAGSVMFGIAFLFAYFWFVAPTNFCGSCFGFRWYIGFMPLLAFYAAREYARHRESPGFRKLFYVLGAISVAFALVGMQQPWQLMEYNAHPAVQMLTFLRGF